MKTIQQFPSWFSKQKLSGKVAIGGVSLLIFCCLCSIPIAIISPSTPKPEATKTSVAELLTYPVVELVIPTETKIANVVSTEIVMIEASPTEAIVPIVVASKTPQSTITVVPTLAQSNTPQPTPTKEDGGLLSGLMPADVTVNLEQRGFTCGSPYRGELYYVRTCEKSNVDALLHVDIYGREAFEIDFIDSAVIQYANPSIDLATSFLGFMATMPYDGAVQQEARTWVETTLPTLTGQGDVRENVFAGVSYQLYGISTAMTLGMGDLP